MKYMPKRIMFLVIIETILLTVCYTLELVKSNVTIVKQIIIAPPATTHILPIHLICVGLFILKFKGWVHIIDQYAAHT